VGIFFATLISRSFTVFSVYCPILGSNSILQRTSLFSSTSQACCDISTTAGHLQEFPNSNTEPCQSTTQLFCNLGRQLLLRQRCEILDCSLWWFLDFSSRGNIRKGRREVGGHEGSRVPVVVPLLVMDMMCSSGVPSPRSFSVAIVCCS
jgi:hypothetical protein